MVSAALNCNYDDRACDCTCLLAEPTKNVSCECRHDTNLQCFYGDDKIQCAYGLNFTCDEPADCTTTERDAYICREDGPSEILLKFHRMADLETTTPCDSIIRCTNVTIETTTEEITTVPPIIAHDAQPVIKPTRPGNGKYVVV